MKLYLAEGKTWTLVTRRKPSVSVPSDLLGVGPVVIVRPRPDSDDVARGPFAAPRPEPWRLFGRAQDKDYRWLTAHEDREDLRQAADAAILALHGWPSLRQHLNLDDPGPTLAEALWELAGVLMKRGRVRATLDQLTGIELELPPNSAVSEERVEVTRRAVSTLDHLNTEVTSRVKDLTRLADEIEAFVHQQGVLQHARSVIRSADYLSNVGDPLAPALDDAKELAERTTAVLAAYRELTHE